MQTLSFEIQLPPHAFPALHTLQHAFIVGVEAAVNGIDVGSEVATNAFIVATNGIGVELGLAVADGNGVMVYARVGVLVACITGDGENNAHIKQATVKTASPAIIPSIR